LKNIIIFGSSRSGKTELAKRLSKKLNYNIVMVDSLVSAFQNSMPELEINHSNRDGKSINNLEPFLLAYLKSINKMDKKARNINYVIEGSYFNFDKIIELQEKFIVVILLSELDSPKDYYDMLKEFDKPHDWTYNLSDEELYKYCENLYSHNKYLLSKCNENNIAYYNTAINREDVFEKILNDIKENLNDQVPFKGIKINSNH
jgi:hypothetical protein